MARTEEIELAPNKLEITNEHRELAKRTIGKDLTEPEFALYLYECNRQGIHPLDRLLIPIKRIHGETGEKRMGFITTIDLFRSRASDSGDYAGNDDAVFEYAEDKAAPYSASVTVWKFVQGQRCGFQATARLSEYDPGGKQGFMWKSKPHIMLGKCAEALALRKAFPKQLAGLFVAEEMEQAEDFKKPDIKPEARATQPRPQAEPEAAADGYISEKERRTVFGVMGQLKLEKKYLDGYLAKNHGVDSTNKMTRAIADDVLVWLNALGIIRELAERKHIPAGDLDRMIAECGGETMPVMSRDVAVSLIATLRSIDAEDAGS